VIRPISPPALVESLADRIAGLNPGRWLRVGIDGAPTSGSRELADALVDPLRVRGRPVVRVHAADFLRPASLRLELGRRNPDSFYERWFDLAALGREVLEPLRTNGSGRILRTFWNPATDRSTRASYVEVPAGGIVVLSGPLLLGAGLELDFTVHCGQSTAALGRRTPPEERWTLPAYERYAEEVHPEYAADLVLRMDDPRHPALVLR
jgi:hypothetical protein